MYTFLCASLWLDYLGKVLSLNLGLADSVRLADQQVLGILYLPSAEITGSCPFVCFYGSGEQTQIFLLAWPAPYQVNHLPSCWQTLLWVGCLKQVLATQP